MRYIIKTAFIMTLMFTIVIGGIYPIYGALVGKIFSYTGSGSMMQKEGKVIGSELIGQKFASPKYFKGRPSVSDYDATSSGASNLAPSNNELVLRINQALNAEKLKSKAKVPIPSDTVTTSASGLDPHISEASAMLQAARIAKARKIPEDRIIMLINENMEYPLFGILGERRINVLKINLALDDIQR